jgi:protease I
MTYSPQNGSARTRVAILLEGGFEDSEFQVPYTALTRSEAEVVVLGTRMNEEYKGKRGKVSVKPNATTTEVLSDDFEDRDTPQQRVCPGPWHS